MIYYKLMDSEKDNIKRYKDIIRKETIRNESLEVITDNLMKKQDHMTNLLRSMSN